MSIFHGPCSCPTPNYDLPAEIYNATMRGRSDYVFNYLARGGDINACYGQNGWTILGAVCKMGYHGILEKILKYPELHLNTVSMYNHPLTWALKGGHTKCAELLFRSTMRCTLDVHSSWSRVVSFLDHKPAFWIEIANKIASYHNLSKLSELIKMKNKNFEVDPVLTKAAIEPSMERVTEILNKKQDIKKYLDGTLIAVSGYDTSEEVAKLLICHSHEYSLESIEASLSLASMNNNLGILPVILQNFFPRISYEGLSNAQQGASKAKQKNANRLLENALDVKCHVYIPNPEFKPISCAVETSNLVTMTPERSLTSSQSLTSESLTPPEEGIEVGTPALEAGKSKEVVDTLADASAELAAMAIDPRLASKGPIPKSFINYEVLSQAAKAQVKVAEALSRASTALAVVSRSVCTGSSGDSSYKGSVSPKSPGYETEMGL